MQIYCEESPWFSGRAQGDAAADIEGNGERYGGGGAQGAQRLREEEEEEREE